MLWIYNIGIAFYAVLLKFASLFNGKAKLFVAGRKDIFTQIASKINADERPIWFHFASLGEFEQGRPVLEAIKTKNMKQKFIITFFSPSGYEIRKNYALAEVFYLPLDTAANAKKFIKIVNPKLAIFTKYEFWYHYFNQLHQHQIPLYLISGIFRPNQTFFKWYGGFYSNILKLVTHFFVQNAASVSLLKSIGLTNVTLSGDTRFDSVFKNTQQVKKLTLIENFCSTSPVFIAGSTWLPDEKLLVKLIEQHPAWKFIIAPHEIEEARIKEIEAVFPNATKFSVLSSQYSITAAQISNLKFQILIIDNIGMLSSLYQYANIAYIGGGFGTGIHNTLEAAAFGLPVIFGPKYDKFQEAKDLIAIGAAKSITNIEELILAFEYFNHNLQASADAKKYVEDNKGATEEILKALNF